MSKSRRVRVNRVEELRPPEQVRRIGRALIALARAQLEADAEAQHVRKRKSGKRQGPASGDAA